MKHCKLILAAAAMLFTAFVSAQLKQSDLIDAVKANNLEGVRAYLDAALAQKNANKMQIKYTILTMIIRHGGVEKAAILDFGRKLAAEIRKESKVNKDILTAISYQANIELRANNEKAAEVFFNEAIKLPNLTKHELARAYKMPYDDFGRRVAVSLETLEAYMRKAMAAVNDAEANVRLWEVLASRAQHTNYYTPLSPRAVPLLEEAIKREELKENRSIIDSLASVYTSLRQEDKAIALFKEKAKYFEDKDKKNAAASLYMVLAERCMKKRYYMQNPDAAMVDKAVAYIVKAMELHPEVQSYCQRLATLCAENDRIDSAITAYAKLIAMPKCQDLTKQEVELALAEAYMRACDLEKTKEWFAKTDFAVLGKNVRLGFRHDFLAMQIACIDGDYAKASACLERLQKSGAQNVYRSRSMQFKDYKARLDALNKK